MNVATFESTCSPASAQSVKYVNAEKFSSLYPRATAAIINKHYVDDNLDSFETIREAVAIVKEEELIHSKCRLALRHFLSNNMEVVQEIREASEIKPKELHLERGEKTELGLGIKWMAQGDVFVYALGLREDLQYVLQNDNIATKCEIARVVISLFDPLHGCLPRVFSRSSGFEAEKGTIKYRMIYMRSVATVHGPI